MENMNNKNDLARDFFAANTPEAFKERFLKEANGDATKAKLIEERFHNDIGRVGENLMNPSVLKK